MSTATLVLLFLLEMTVHGSEEVANFTGCQLLVAIPSTVEDLAFLHDLQHQELPGLEVWSGASSLTSNATIQVCPEGRQNLTSLLSKRGIRHVVEVEDLQSIIDSEKMDYQLFGRRFYKSSGLNTFAFDQYHPMTEIDDFLDVAARQFPGRLSVTMVGSSAEGKPLRVVKLGTKSSKEKPIIWVDSGIHAREWVTISSTLYIIHRMLNSNDTSIKTLLQTYDWYWMPVVNPDGYEYTWTYNRLWRKNRSKCRDTRTQCCGVDLNRNFAARFEGSHSSSTFRCSQIYKGDAAFSEPESEVLRRYVSGLQRNLKAFVTLHSYSQVWLLPYGYQHSKPRADHYKDMLEVATKATQALEKVHGTRYRCGTVADIMYVTSGSSVDWAYDTLKVKYSYAVELRDTGRYGFLLPSSQLIPTAEELLQSLTTMAEEIARRES